MYLLKTVSDSCPTSTKCITKHIRVCLLLSLSDMSVLLRNSLFKDSGTEENLHSIQTNTEVKSLFSYLTMRGFCTLEGCNCQITLDMHIGIVAIIIAKSNNIMDILATWKEKSVFFLMISICFHGFFKKKLLRSLRVYRALITSFWVTCTWSRKAV